MPPRRRAAKKNEAATTNVGEIPATLTVDATQQDTGVAGIAEPLAGHGTNGETERSTAGNALPVNKPTARGPRAKVPRSTHDRRMHLPMVQETTVFAEPVPPIPEHAPEHNHRPHRVPSPAESFNLDVSRSDTDEGPFPNIPTTPPRKHSGAPGNRRVDANATAIPVQVVPRAGPHSPNRGAQQKQRKVSRTIAVDVWEFFEEIDGKRYCSFCQHDTYSGKMYARRSENGTYSAKTGTGTLRKHLYTCHLELWLAACELKKIPITSKEALAFMGDQNSSTRSQTNSEAEPVPRVDFSQKAFVDALVDFIVADDQSINVVENVYLRKIFLMLRKELCDEDIPHRTKIRSRIAERLDIHIETMKARLERALGKVSTTSDIWSDSNLRSYMAVTAHWMEMVTVDGQDELRLASGLIGFREMPGHHTGEHLSVAFLHIIDRLDIADKLGWVTLDNASNNDSFMHCLETALRRRGIWFNRKENRIRCFPHIVNLACQAVLGAISNMELASKDSGLDDVYDDPIAVGRDLIRTIRSSSLRRQYFSEIVQALKSKDLQLLRDVDTRWSSTLLMIERLTELRKAIETFLSDEEFNELASKYTISPGEWDLLEKYKEILKVPHAFQQKLSAEKTPTLCRAIPSFEAMIKVWTDMQQKMPEMSDIIQKGIEKLETYRERTRLSKAYILAMALNPYIKLEWIRKHDYEGFLHARTMLVDEVLRYHNDPVHTSPQKQRVIVRDGWADNVLEAGFLFAGPTPMSAGRSIEAEVEMYLADVPLLPQISLVLYWQQHCSKYPNLFSLAMDILPVQGSAVPCERVFSSSKETMTPRRNQIRPKLMEALQLLKFSLKQSSLNFTAGTDKDSEIEVLERKLEAELRLPEEMNDFIAGLKADLLAKKLEVLEDPFVEDETEFD